MNFVHLLDSALGTPRNGDLIVILDYALHFDFDNIVVLCVIISMSNNMN